MKKDFSKNVQKWFKKKHIILLNYTFQYFQN